jgi:uncharacterized protein (DUF58 family)
MKTKLKITAALLAYCIGIPLFILAYPTLYRFGILMERGMIQLFAPDLLPALANPAADASRSSAQAAEESRQSARP